MKQQVNRREFLQLSALGLVGGIIAACSPSPKAPPAPTQAPSGGTEPTTAAPVAEKVELRWLDWSDMDDLVDGTIATFRERYPNVTINFEPIGDSWGDKQLTQMISGTAPDILTGYDNTSYLWAEKDQLLDLNPLVERDLTAEQVDDFFTHQWEGLIYPGNGIRMGLPYYAWVYQYYFNKDAFDEAGVPYPTQNWTVDDLSSALEQLTQRDANGKVTRWGGADACYEPFRFQLWLRMFGGGMVDPEDWTRCILSTDESKEALEWHRHRLWDTNTLAQAMQMEALMSLDALATGRVAIQGQGAGDMFSLLTNPPGFNWAIMSPPIGPTGTPISLGTIDNWGVWKGTKAPDMAWEFVKLVALEDDFQKGSSALWGSAPNRKSLLPDYKVMLGEQYPGLQDDQIDPQIRMLTEGQVRVGAQFKQHKASLEVITPVLEKIFHVGDSPVSIVDEICEEVTALNDA